MRDGAEPAGDCIVEQGRRLLPPADLAAEVAWAIRNGSSTIGPVSITCWVIGEQLLVAAVARHSVRGPAQVTRE